MGGRMGGALGERSSFFCMGGNSERVKCFWMSAKAHGLLAHVDLCTVPIHKAAHVQNAF